MGKGERGTAGDKGYRACNGWPLLTWISGVAELTPVRNKTVIVAA